MIYQEIIKITPLTNDIFRESLESGELFSPGNYFQASWLMIKKIPAAKARQLHEAYQRTATDLLAISLSQVSVVPSLRV